MKKKINIKAIIGIVVFLAIGFFIFFGRKDLYSLSISEKNWLNEYSKVTQNYLMINDYPIYSGEDGVFENLYKYIKTKATIDFNESSVGKEDNEDVKEFGYKYIRTGNTIKRNEFLINEDNYAVVGTDYYNIDSIGKLSGKTIGVLHRDANDVSYYLRSVSNINYSAYKTIDEAVTALKSKKVNLLIIPNIMYFDRILKNNLIINYSIDDMSNKLVFKVPDDKKLLKIMTKLFNGWQKKEFKEAYNEKLLEYYSGLKGINEAEKKNIASRKYVYGFVNNPPYEKLVNKRLKGINAEYLERFSRFANVEFSYKEFENYEALKKALDKKEVDIFFNYYDLNVEGYTMANSSYSERYVVLAKDDVLKVITSIESLCGKDVLMMKNTALHNFFKDRSKANILEYSNLDQMIKAIGDDVLVIDYETYSYYKTTKLKRFKLLHDGYISKNYAFMINNKYGDFYKLFNYITNANSYYKYRDIAMVNMILIDRTIYIKKVIVLLILIMVLVPLVMLLIQRYKNKDKFPSVKKLKENKKIYTDSLTGLKNRAYLNDSIELWNEIDRPQAIVAVDLNNIKYINDKYGYKKGDEEIKNAASILIRTQLEQSEIMRTDGNEFIIYLLGYSPEAIKVYVDRLKKEFKSLSCGYGASVGYAYLNDEIFLIEDVISEAIANMREEKDEEKSR